MNKLRSKYLDFYSTSFTDFYQLLKVNKYLITRKNSQHIYKLPKLLI